jgi:auxin response factor
MFGLEGLLTHPQSSGWKLVYVDYESDVLLVGDDPWEEFVGCVRCIRILSPTEVQQMSEEGMKLLNSAGINDLKTSVS